ncbi:MAG: FIST N domain protein [Syntrophus sp. PtaU1.Bin208]|nr:MAG: FIST N domain protein [Syntrophus sp. PtaU1.Bin208]
MKVAQYRWNTEGEWHPEAPAPDGEVQLALVFSGGKVLKKGGILASVKNAYPSALITGCSTAGEIAGTQVSDGTGIVTAIRFDDTQVRGTQVYINNAADSMEAGGKLAAALNSDGLRHVFVLSDGLNINGSELVRGLSAGLPDQVTITGGLSADGDRFQETFVVWNGAITTKAIVALGFYGNRLSVGYGSYGGWDQFGPERLVTRAVGNTVYELDNKPALALYKRYLGEYAHGLPATALLFPLSISAQNGGVGTVRTILGVCEETGSMTFAGDVPQGSTVRLMKANFERLIDGANEAARISLESAGSCFSPLAILISCVGRKLILKQRVEEEVESVQEVLGNQATLTGFYSYGEIAPFQPGAECELHNQTMTVTTFCEK